MMTEAEVKASQQKIFQELSCPKCKDRLIFKDRQGQKQPCREC